MPLWRAIRVSLVTYLATILLAGLGSLAIGQPVSLDHPPTSDTIFLAMIIADITIAVGAWWYLRPADVRGGPLPGFLFAIVAIVVAVLLDAIAALILAMANQDSVRFLRDSYSHWFFGIMMVVAVSLCTIVGASKTRHGGY